MIHPSRLARIAASWFAVLALVAPVARATPAERSPAEHAPAELAVIRVEQGLAYIGIGRKQGVVPGQALEVVTREGNDEPFHLGWIVLESCGESVSMAHVPQELAPYVKQGTHLRLPSVANAASAPPAPPTPSAPPAPPSPPTPLPTPATTPHALIASEPTPTHAEPIARPPVTPLNAVRHQPPTTMVPPGVPLTLSVFVPPPLARPVLMYRLSGEHTYRALAFTPQADFYFIAAIPASAVQAPGIEYYIVVDSPEAPRRLAFATPEEPEHVTVEGRFNETSELARYGVRDELSTTGELVSYNSAGAARDYYYRVEGEYLHRIFKNVYSMRFGAGYLSGQAYDDSNNLTHIGFLYAYTETELRASETPIAFIPRLIFGVDNSGVGGGFEARVRLGDELGMNFEGGVTVLSELGFETFTKLTLHPTPRAAIALAAYLENLPLANELGFRMYGDLRYRIQHATWLTLRLGAAARSIQTIGPDTGLGLAWGF